MCNEFAKVAKEASTNENAIGHARKHMDEMEAKIRAFKAQLILGTTRIIRSRRLLQLKEQLNIL
jgi:hypothetical protein